MPKVPEIIPITDLRQNAAEVLKRVQETDEPLVITQRGRAAAVLLSRKFGDLQTINSACGEEIRLDGGGWYCLRGRDLQ